ncbi:LRRC4C [Branchiostoma lanceolatum]|uniref:LRRC4C protein n=1 Tax=Branchiostoma lanceolatum TaxID=7740 RepID=A0A8K0EK02_BRALA|nr:LRRC4C [Branchiostoma lanceolatum]
MCNTTGQTDENQLGCLPPTLEKLQVAGHSDSNGKLKPLPGLGQLGILLLGPGHILTAERETFSAVPNLRALSLSNNAFKVIGGWFGTIKRLKKLQLCWNKIEEIQKNALQPLAKLQFLSLRFNRLRAVEEWHFAGLTNLKYLHLSYNNISRIAGKSFDQLPRLYSLSLQHNKLSSVPAELLTAMRGIQVVYIEANPFRCTCALESLKSEGLGSTALKSEIYNRLQCSYPPRLSGREIANLERDEMPCPSPTARASRQDDGATLVCEVFWERQPEIRWLDPRGRAVGERESLDPCDGAVSTSLEHEIPTTQSPEGETAHSADDPGLPYIGKSTSTLRMSQQAYRCWTEGSFRCVVQSTPGKVSVDLTFTKPSETSEREQTQEHTKMAAVDTTIPVQQNAKVTERIIKPTDKKAQQDGTTTQATYKTHRNTVMTPVFTGTAVPQDGGITGRMTKPTEKNTQKEGTTPAPDKALWQTVLMIGVYILIAGMAVVFLYKVVASCRKRYKKHQNQRQYLQGIAAGAIGGIPLQNIQPPATAPTTGNLVPPQQAYDEIPDDTPITPYAETSRLENPVYGEDVTGPKGATSMPDPRPRPTNSGVSSRPQLSRIAQTGKAPDPPPRSDRQANVSDSHYYPPGTKTTQAEVIPDPLPRTRHTYVNSNVSSQPQGLEMASRSRQEASLVDPQGSAMDDVDGPNIYFDLNGSSRLSGSEMPQTEKIPDPLPRTHTYVNSNVSSQPQGSKKSKHMPRSGAPSDPQSSRTDEEEKVEGPNIYLDLNT